jgi:hypothetical protein
MEMTTAELSNLPRQELSDLFRRLVDQWRHDTDALSDPARTAMHPAYQRIIGLGPQVLPLILQEMQCNGGHWFWALRAISGDNPVTPDIAGRIPAMKEAWLQWARQKGLQP